MSSVRPAVTAFILGLLLLLPFTSTPVGNQLAAAHPAAFGWVGWVSREIFEGGDAGYIAGVLFGALLYALLRHSATKAQQLH